MKELVDRMKTELVERQKILEQVRQKLRTLPEGNLVIMHKGGCAYYYTGGNSARKYLRKGSEQLIRELAMRQYCEQLEQALQNEIKALSRFLSHYRFGESEAVYENLSEERKKLVIPALVPDGQFLADWKTKMEARVDLGQNPYEKDGYLKTRRGECVRSKSEKIIADTLLENEIPYYYELPLKLRGQIWYPDFTLLNVRTRKTWYWEHFGLADSPEYMEKAVQKMEAYRRAGLWGGDGLIQSFETQKMPLGTDVIDAIIEKYLK